MIRPALLLAVLFLPVAPAFAQNMPLPTFIQRAGALEKLGPLALLKKGELDELMGELKRSGAALKAERLAAEKAGRKPLYCPPADGGSMGPQKLLAQLRAIPADRARTMTTRDGMRHVAVTNYPCRK